MIVQATTQRPNSELGVLVPSSSASVGLSPTRAKSEPPETTYRALSLGAGVQSSVLALLFSRQDARLEALGYPKPDCAIFADTGWEPRYVYEHLDWLETQLEYPLIRVQAGNIEKNLKKAVTVSGHNFVDVPFYLINPDGTKGSVRRQCTTHYKINPIQTRIRTAAGGKPRRVFPKDKHVEMWIGISSDEILRMKPSREHWITHRWPLVDLGWSRSDCMQWFSDEYPGRQLPRSACVICPYRSDRNWLEIKLRDPKSFDDAVKFDNQLRSRTTTPIRQTLKGRPYLHDSRRPLATMVAEFERKANTLDDRPMEQSNSFNNECEGMCGV